jgi:urease accessory protein
MTWLLLSPAPAFAHLVTTGMGPVYDGIGHLLLTPEDLVPVVAMALYAGLWGAAAGRRALFLLPLAWFAGGLAGMLAGQGVPVPSPLWSFFVLGALVAGDFRLPSYAVTLLVVVIGLVHGFGNGMAFKAGVGVPGLLGVMTMLFVLVALLSAFVVSLEKTWARVAVRVTGSWVFASGLLMYGWLLRGQS